MPTHAPGRGWREHQGMHWPHRSLPGRGTLAMQRSRKTKCMRATAWFCMQASAAPHHASWVRKHVTGCRPLAEQEARLQVCPPHAKLQPCEQPQLGQTI
eukprot:7380536-Prymnesium_polylepis.2